MSIRDGEVRLAELLATLSLGTDLGFGQPMEHVIRQCLIALRMSDLLGFDASQRAVLYYAGLLAWVGCHTDAYEQAKWLGDDLAMKADTFNVSFVTVRQDSDLAPLLKGLPDDRCQCPHWGYMFTGRQTVRYADHEEVFEAGDAFYMSPGHTPAADAGSEFLIMSPAEQFAETEAVMRKNALEMQTNVH